MIRKIIPGRHQRVRRCPQKNVTIAGILISSIKVLAAADRCSWDRWLTLNNRRQSIGPKPDSRRRLEGARYQVPDKAAHSYSALHYPSVTHTLTHIINQTPALPGLAQWVCYKKVSAHGSRVGWTPARRNRTGTEQGVWVAEMADCW